MPSGRPDRMEIATSSGFAPYFQVSSMNAGPIAPPPVGQQAAISGHLATLSFKNQKKAIWDDAAKKVRFA